MAQELNDGQMEVLRAAVAIQEKDLVATVHAIAGEVGWTVPIVIPVVNQLWQAGLITHTLAPTDEGKRVLATAEAAA